VTTSTNFLIFIFYKGFFHPTAKAIIHFPLKKQNTTEFRNQIIYGQQQQQQARAVWSSSLTLPNPVQLNNHGDIIKMIFKLLNMMV
jgi:hypothetical protein